MLIALFWTCPYFHTSCRKPLLCTAFLMNYASVLQNNIMGFIIFARIMCPIHKSFSMFTSLPIADPDLISLTDKTLSLDVAATINWCIPNCYLWSHSSYLILKFFWLLWTWSWFPHPVLLMPVPPWFVSSTHILTASAFTSSCFELLKFSFEVDHK